MITCVLRAQIKDLKKMGNANQRSRGATLVKEEGKRGNFKSRDETFNAFIKQL